MFAESNSYRVSSLTIRGQVKAEEEPVVEEKKSEKKKKDKKKEVEEEEEPVVEEKKAKKVKLLLYPYIYQFVLIGPIGLGKEGKESEGGNS